MSAAQFHHAPWLDEFPAVVTVCNLEGKIVYLNNKALKNFENDGGAALIGSDIFNCHPEPSRSKLRELMAKAGTNIYYTLKKGESHLIHQCPLYENGRYTWYAEFIFVIPEGTATHNRDKV